MSYQEPLHVGRPNIGSRDALLRRVNEMLDRRWLTNDGVFVREFEQMICSVMKVKHAVAMCNATIAMEIAIRACGLHGEVIVPSYTFVATAHAMQWQEITPVFCDIDPSTHAIDAAAIERLVTPRTTGIVGVHVWGNPCDHAAIESVAKTYGLTVLYDAAHAFGVFENGSSIANWGRASILSFHATKFINAFEGGAVVTNDEALASKMRLMRNFGFAGEDEVVYVGTNGKMCEASAAMGITSLESLDRFIATNHENYEQYAAELRGLSGVRLFPYSLRNRNNYQYIVVEFDPETCGVSRDDVKVALAESNVLARRYFWPGCHRMEPYRSLYPNSHLWLTETERVASRVLVLPTGSAVTHQDIVRVTTTIRRMVGG